MQAGAGAKAVFLEGAVRPVILSHARVMIVGLLLLGTVDVVDATFIGFHSSASLIAFSFVSPFIGVFVSLWIGFGIGATTRVALAVGAGHKERATTVGAVATMLIIPFALLFGVVVALVGDRFYALLGGPNELSSRWWEYVTVWGAGLPFLGALITGSALLRGFGETRISSVIFMLSGAINLVLDPILIFGIGPVPELGLRGAAIATVTGNAIGAAYAYRLLVAKGYLQPKIPGFLQIAGNVLRVSGPAMASQAVVPLATLLLTFIVSAFGANAVAIFVYAAIAGRFVLMLPLALGSVVGPFSGQNWAARNFERTTAGWFEGVRLSTFWTFAVYVVAFAGGCVVIWLADIAEPTSRLLFAVLLIYPIGLVCNGICIVSNAVFNGVGQAVPPGVLTVIGHLLLIPTLAYAVSVYLGIQGFFLGFAAGALLLCIATVLVMKRRGLVGSGKLLRRGEAG